jgi:2'-5' RNA ligase
MHGLVSLLPEPFYSQVEGLWHELKDEHGLRGIHVTPLPHFSWQIAEDYDFDQLRELMLTVCQETAQFMVRTAGLALFSGVRPVIYIPVVKDEHLLNLHVKIWERSQPAAKELSPYYNPSFWMPHISLAYQDVSIQNIGPVMEKFAFRTFNWQMQIDNISLIFEPDGEIGALKFRLPLTG